MVAAPAGGGNAPLAVSLETHGFFTICKEFRG
jgi:hypothetical protein